MGQTRFDATALWADLEAVRERAPLVHSITNLVVMNFNANALLAIGASPVMAHAHEEVRDMVGIAQALVLNIGTLEPSWIRAMQIALQAARARGIPVVLDPVGAGATPYRNTALKELIAAGAPSVVRGNASEIMSVAGLAATTRGVDSAASSNQAVDAARRAGTQAGGGRLREWRRRSRRRCVRALGDPVQRPPLDDARHRGRLLSQCAGGCLRRCAARRLARHGGGDGLPRCGRRNGGRAHAGGGCGRRTAANRTARRSAAARPRVVRGSPQDGRPCLSGRWGATRLRRCACAL